MKIYNVLRSPMCGKRWKDFIEDAGGVLLISSSYERTSHKTEEPENRLN
jgi:hypothetical protein